MVLLIDELSGINSTPGTLVRCAILMAHYVWYVVLVLCVCSVLMNGYNKTFAVNRHYKRAYSSIVERSIRKGETQDQNPVRLDLYFSIMKTAFYVRMRCHKYLEEEVESGF